MAHIRNWDTGIAPTSASCPSLYAGPSVITRRRVLWVDSTHSRASNSNAGTEREEPLATLLYAVNTASAAGDIIIVGAGHTESLGTILTPLAGVAIVGLGSGTGRPLLTKNTVTDGDPGTDDALINCSNAGVEIRNLEFTETFGESDNNPYIRCGAGGLVVDACTFYQKECLMAIRFNSGCVRPRIQNCVFNDSRASEATGVAVPTYAILFNANTSGCRITGNTFDGGSTLASGFDGGAIHIGAINQTGFYEYGNTFKNCADLIVDSGGTLRGMGGGSTWVGGSARFETDRVRWYDRGLVPMLAESTTDVWYGGNALLYAQNFWTTGSVYWVRATGGSDSNDGLDPSTPFATVGAALSVMSGSAGDLILVASDHTQSITAAETAQSGKPFAGIWGLGSGDARPLLTVAYAGRWMDLDAAGQEVHGMRFASSGTDTRAELLRLSAAGTICEGCSFTNRQYDTSAVTVTSAGLDSLVESNTFEVSAYASNLPVQGLLYQVTGEGSQRVANNQFNGTGARWLNGGMSNNGGGSAASKCECVDNTITARGHIVTTSAVNWLVSRTASDRRTRVQM